MPIDLPSWAVNALGVNLFNRAVFGLQRGDRRSRAEHYERFFFPLDRVVDWNRLYGKRGFYQYQCVIPSESDAAVREILERVSASRQGSFLSVLKKFGAIPSPGLLSFPREGFTLALDFANRGARTLALLDALDGVVAQAGGCVYPAKDARMSAASFERYFPQWKEFARYIDPRFSSSFWRRVTKGAAA